MDKLKSIVFLVVILTLTGLVGYWSVSTIQSGSENVTSEKIKQLEQENKDLKTEVESLAEELDVLKPKAASLGQVEEDSGSQKPSTPTQTKSAVSEHQALIDELQKLSDDGILMRLKSSGTRVGTVQKFLNIYNDTSSRVDNDFGAGTQKLVMDFQRAEGLSPDGEAGEGTFNKMIEWLKKQ